MNMFQPKTEKIQLYVVRDFGQRLSVVMDYMRQNWKPLLLYLTYFLLPLSLVQALSLNGFMGSYIDLIGGLAKTAGEPTASGIVSMVLHLGAFLGLYMIGAVLMYAVVYGVMRRYERGDGQQTALTWQDLKPDFFFSLKRSVILMLAGAVVAIALLLVMGGLIALAAMITPALIFLIYIVVLAFAICLAPPLSLITPVYVFEDKQTFMGAVKKGLRLGFGTWLGTVGVMFILYFIINIVTQFVTMPWAIMFFLKMFFGMGLDGLDGSWTESVFFSFGTYLTGVLECYGGYIASSAVLVGAAFLYGHAAEKLDNVTVESNIRNFENL